MRSHQERRAPSPRSVVRYAACGLMLGVGWGVAVGAWRLLAADAHSPSRGTPAVVVCAGLAGAFVGVSYGAGRQGAPRSWRALALPAVALFLGPGLLFLPAFLIGGWGLRRGPVGRRCATLSVMAAPAALAYAWWQRTQDGVGIVPGALTLVALAVGTTVLAVASAWAGNAAFGPWPSLRDHHGHRAHPAHPAHQAHPGHSGRLGHPVLPVRSIAHPPVYTRARAA